uniref:Uncharacterized protein n=1 Tax=Amphiprion ocellaris TaxID=80972 RepID=A0AAQ5ZUY7_AMPOC
MVSSSASSFCNSSSCDLFDVVKPTHCRSTSLSLSVNHSLNDCFLKAVMILWQQHISKESNPFLSADFIVQDSEPYDVTAKAVDLNSLTLRDEGSLLFHGLVMFCTTICVGYAEQLEIAEHFYMFY